MVLVHGGRLDRQDEGKRIGNKPMQPNECGLSERPKQSLRRLVDRHNRKGVQLAPQVASILTTGKSSSIAVPRPPSSPTQAQGPAPEPRKKLSASYSRFWNAAVAGLHVNGEKDLRGEEAAGAAGVGEKESEYEPLDPHAALALASLRTQGQPPRPNAAVTYACRALATNPNCFLALQCRAAANCMLCNFVEAITDAERALYLLPMDVHSWLWKGTAHFHLREYAEAAAAFRRGLQYEPTHARMQRGYHASQGWLKKTGGQQERLQHGGSKTRRDLPSEFVTVGSLDMKHPDASVKPGSVMGAESMTNAALAKFNAPALQLQSWRQEATEEVALASEVGPPGSINLVTWLGQDVEFLRQYYSDGGQFKAEGAMMMDNAIRQLGVFFPPSCKAPRPAIIFDVDETALTAIPMLRSSNPPFDRIPELEHLWVTTASAVAVVEVLRFYRWVRKHQPQVALIFLSGRRRTEFQATERNLHEQGYVGYSRLLVRDPQDKDKTMAAFKLEQREQLEKDGFTIVATVGDQVRGIGFSPTQQPRCLALRVAY